VSGPGENAQRFTVRKGPGITRKKDASRRVGNEGVGVPPLRRERRKVSRIRGDLHPVPKEIHQKVFTRLIIRGGRVTALALRTTTKCGHISWKKRTSPTRKSHLKEDTSLNSRGERQPGFHSGEKDWEKGTVCFEKKAGTILRK